MTPAIISIVLRFELKLGISDSYDSLYNHCKNNFVDEVNRSIRPGSRTYKQLEPYLKQSIDQDTTDLVQRLIRGGQGQLPYPIDEAGQLKLMANKVAAQITKGDVTADIFEMYLFFSCEPVTLVGTLGEKLLVALGDKSAEIASKTPIPVFSIRHMANIWFESYKKI
ncbi:MAG: hypothetical protein ACJ77K_03315 [Bacteroidia bacterium]